MNRRKVIIKRILAVTAIVVLTAFIVTVAVGYRILRRPDKEHTGQGATNVLQAIQGITEIVRDPYSGFPGKNRVVILCMGIDDNWTNSDQVYTKDARTDTLFLLTLDLPNHQVTMLSIPRDTYTHIYNTHWTFKINSAYSLGGPERTMATVAELTGVQADYYMVLNIDATKKMVDAIGGVDVDVEHEMHYHDKWGHLNIDLMPGPQHLNGDQAVGFARYRHPDAGGKSSPEDGDERRTYRQHVLMRAMVAKAKTFSNIVQANSLIDVGLSAIRTKLSRKQLLDLAVIFHGMQPDDIRSATLPGEDFRGPKNEWFFRLYPNAMRAYVDWLVRGDETAARSLTPVVVKNDTEVPRLAAHAALVLRRLGYADVRVVSGPRPHPRVHLAADAPATPTVPTSALLDTGVPDPNIVNDITANLGINSAVTKRVPNKPNHLGWTAPAAVTIDLGQDYAQAVQAAGGVPVGETDMPPPVKESAPTFLPPADNLAPSAPDDATSTSAPSDADSATSNAPSPPTTSAPPTPTVPAR